jgi:hypothetical protein
MHSFGIVVAATLLAAGCAKAQSVDLAATGPEALSSSNVLTVTPSPYNGTGYVINDVERPQSDLSTRMRSDPRFRAGVNLNRYLSLEGGYLERKDRGWHNVDVTDPLDPDGGDSAGALGVRGFHTYGAVKVTLPLTDRLSANGMLGENYSERRGRTQAGQHTLDVDTGMVTRLGAEYKVSNRTSLNLDAQNFGNTAKKWGGGLGGTNANWLKAALKIGL